MTTRSLLKELVPSLALRVARRLRRGRASAPAEPDGRERDAAYYDERFRINEHWRRHYTESHYYPLWAVLADRVGHRTVRSVLDVGCGPGQMAMVLCDLGVPRYLGIDFSPARVAQARKVCPGFEFEVADVFETDLLRTREYDTVVCTEFLEHVERDTEVLRMLRPGSWFLGTVPNFPAQGHVRHFTDAAEVRERYASLFEDLRVDAHLASRSGTRYYIMEGTLRAG